MAGARSIELALPTPRPSLVLQLATMKSLRVCQFLAVAASFLLGISARAQTYRLEGRVIDQSGASIPKAKVTMVSDEQIREFTADDKGQFVISDLPAATYTFEAQFPGFETKTVEMTLDDRSAGSVAIPMLRPGSCAQCVTVCEWRDPATQSEAYREAFRMFRAESKVSYGVRTGEENFVGTVKDYAGLLGGVTLTITGPDGPSTLISDQSGKFGVVGMVPGKYSITARGYNISAYGFPVVSFWVARQNTTTVTIDASTLYFNECSGNTSHVDPSKP